MTRTEFMNQLAALLKDIPEAEKDEAIEYYNNYFDDAGLENESEVLSEMGTPDEAAANIKAGLSGEATHGEVTENGFSNHTAQKRDELANPEDIPHVNRNFENPAPVPVAPKQGLPTWAIILIVAACIICSPVLLGIAGGLLGLILGILGGLLGLILAFAGTSIGLLVAAVFCFIYGIVNLISTPMAALVAIGGSLICLAIGLFFLWLVVIICGGLIPLIIKGIIKLFTKKSE